MPRRHLLAAFLAACLNLLTVPHAGAAAFDFESLNDGDALTNQLSGLLFVNTMILSAGITLNEFEFPPASGTNVAVSDAGPVRINLTSPVASFGAFFTYAAPITLEAFDASGNGLGMVSSAYGSNLLLSGDAGSSPNEFLQLAASDMAYVVISAGSGGDVFAFDDVTTRGVPEPTTLALVLGGSLAVFTRARRAARRRAVQPPISE